ncbi:MAG TPA: type IV toxin-antitoxin system AbiEi family antitoxin domain-containing protein [Microbacterium sp.]|uniref:type IV toxin-antitoxin system AbiEi family antitoxin domain-containing protein n=1 Tax=Microbacterium sp. TaxID=51671 RepID=UPI002B45A448|nr:type IV toxin-antitoxin system AbiEi family antitoxin domain-containing protein [Microbacterium sp.]HKT55847.1 type IV toxin-antitoxin system AbiEi family antitoxin domain-containing protein [Microbacterium sp.]
MSTEPDAQDAPRFFRTRDLAAEGWTAKRLARAVRDGSFLRLRKGVYGQPGLPEECASAVRIGGRLCGSSELRRRGVFVQDHPGTHVHIEPEASRLPPVPEGIHVQRGMLRRTPHPRSCSVEVLDAVIQSAKGQPWREGLATIESAVQLGVLRIDELGEVFAALPRRYRRARRWLDTRSESGTETIMRLIALELGAGVEVQVWIRGVGRVDLVIDGWLIVECDSERFHSDWRQRREDLRRDQAAARLGYSTYRPIAEDIMWHRDEVRAALAGLLAGGRPARARRAGTMSRG